MTRRRTKGFAEDDVFTSWRRLYCWTQRAGACKKVKRRANRRERRQARSDVNERLEETEPEF